MAVGLGSVQNRDEDPSLGQLLHDAAGLQNSDASEWLERGYLTRSAVYKLESTQCSCHSRHFNMLRL
jgi:hypothetical protein